MMRLTALAVFLILASGLVGLDAARTEDPPAPGFPHDRHASLFPTCTACHGGLAEAGGPAYTVTPEDCAACHDGEVQPVVEWTAPAPGDGRLRFDHPLHLEDVGATCADCHTRPGGGSRMDLVRTRFEACQDCHGLDEHFAETNDCTVCHVPLASMPVLTSATVLSLPRPEDHDDADFLIEHGVDASEVTRCAVCHTRDLCERCHLDAGRVEAIAALAPDGRVEAVIGGREGQWPVPASHQDPEWMYTHGVEAGSGTTCATCHTQAGCRTCHAGVVPEAVLALTDAEPGAAVRGVQLPDAHPPLHDANFVFEHGAAAATNHPRCASCHEASFCDACHAGAETPGFHPVNFLMRHGADAFGRERDCASCHSTETFCRDCHAQSGLARVGVGTSAYHDAQPDWLLAHGQAARQGMESCASCHQQRDCLPCHSAKGGWSINPHGPGFDADRLSKRSQLMCARCHFDQP